MNFSAQAMTVFRGNTLVLVIFLQEDLFDCYVGVSSRSLSYWRQMFHGMLKSYKKDFQKLLF